MLPVRGQHCNEAPPPRLHQHPPISIPGLPGSPNFCPPHNGAALTWLSLLDTWLSTTATSSTWSPSPAPYGGTLTRFFGCPAGPRRRLHTRGRWGPLGAQLWATGLFAASWRGASGRARDFPPPSGWQPPVGPPQGRAGRVLRLGIRGDHGMNPGAQHRALCILIRRSQEVVPVGTPVTARDSLGLSTPATLKCGPCGLYSD